LDDLSALTPDPCNARAHSERNLNLIATSLHEVGAARSIVVDEDGVILAGNATVTAAQQAGIDRVRIVDADGSELIAVRRTNLSPEQKRRLALLDNRTAELATWDSSVLASLAEDTDLSDLWEPDELAELLGEAPEVCFPEFDETAEEQVAYVECPSCGHRFPR
jgi:ParB-like chromosome segregation protein Spo0J